MNLSHWKIILWIYYSVKSTEKIDGVILGDNKLNDFSKK